MPRLRRPEGRMRFTIAERRTRATDLYLKGHPQYKIAEILGVAKSTITSDIQAVRKEWQKERLDDFFSARMRELKKLDALENEAWEAWRRSQRNAVKRKVKQKENEADERETTTEPQVGDPRFLQVIRDCVERRCKLLGLDSPERAPVDETGETVRPQIVVDVVQQMLQEQDYLDHLRSQTLEADRHAGHVRADSEQGSVENGSAPGPAGSGTNGHSSRTE